MQKLNIKIINRSGNALPNYQTNGSSGVDLMAYLSESIFLRPLERSLIPTGLFIEIPEGFEAQVRSRSGLAIKQGLICLNSPGTIDADYRGEIKIILINLSSENIEIKSGDRVAQMIFQKIEKVILTEVTSLENSERGSGGFGHTGI